MGEKFTKEKQVQRVKRLPPHSKPLDERVICNNPPYLVRICYGQGSWDKAKYFNKFDDDTLAIVMPSGESPKNYRWPVKNCDVAIIRLAGPGDSSINELIICLLSSGAKQVCLSNNNVDPVIVIYRAGGA